LLVLINTIAYAIVPRKLNGDATALFSMARKMFGGIGIAISTALLMSGVKATSGGGAH
jgi:MFS transporter, DHA2 family, multidrug resistance protein